MRTVYALPSAGPEAMLMVPPLGKQSPASMAPLSITLMPPSGGAPSRSGASIVVRLLPHTDWMSPSASVTLTPDAWVPALP